MRTPEQIKAILNTIECYWEQNPEMRLGQLLSNASIIKQEGAKLYDIFYVEDAEWETYLRDMTKILRKAKRQ